MRFSLLMLPLLALLISPTQADYLLSEYPEALSDSAQVRARYGIIAIANAASSATVSTTKGSVILNASKIASDSGKGYSASVTLVHPLQAIDTALDLTGWTSIDFEYRNSAIITEYFAISLGSPLYSDEQYRAGTVYQVGISGTIALAAGAAWKKASAPIADFALPKWWTDIPEDFPTLEEVMKHVKDIRFSPMTKYSDSGMYEGKPCSRCMNPTMTSQTLEIRNVTLVGLEINTPPNPSSTRRPNLAHPLLAARYHGGVLSIDGSAGYDRFEIRSLDGHRIGNVASTGRWNVSLPRGTYLLVGVKGGKTDTRRFPVVGF